MPVIVKKILYGVSQWALTFLYCFTSMNLYVLVVQMVIGNDPRINSADLAFSYFVPLFFSILSGYLLTIPFLYVIYDPPAWGHRAALNTVHFLLHVAVFSAVFGTRPPVVEEMPLISFGLACVLAAEVTTRWLWGRLPHAWRWMTRSGRSSGDAGDA
jgi:hypothetical protein